MSLKSYNIGVVGLWHLGEIYSACLADLGHKVVGVSDDKRLIAGLKKGMPPLAEPELVDLLKRNISKKHLSFSTDFKKLRDVKVLWITLDIPVNDEDDVSMDDFWSLLDTCIPHLKDGVTIAVSSQLPVGTSATIIKRIKKSRPGLKFEYFYSPENLRLGQGIKSFMHQARVVVGANTAEAHSVAKALFAPLKNEVMQMGIASAEMAKHAVNSWLATSISFTNDLADACEHTGADVEEVIKALKAESRIGNQAYLFAGLGFSGGTLGRDLKALISLRKNSKLSLPLIESVYRKNQERHLLVYRRLKQHFGKISGKTFAIFGITYKPGTSTLRRSMPLHIEKFLRKEGATLRLSDTMAIKSEVAKHTPSFFTKDHYEAAKGAHAVLVLSPDIGFRELDFARLAKSMKVPIIFDAQNILIPKEGHIKASGFKYWSVGRNVI